MENIEKDILSLVSKIIKQPEDKIDPNANIFRTYGVDSLLGVEILAGLDKKYNIDVPEDKIKNIRTLNDIVKIAKEQIAKK